MTLASVSFGPIGISQPLWFMLLGPSAILIVWFAAKSLSGLGTTAKRVALGVRLFVAFMICAALAEPSWRTESDKLAVTVVIDTSRSVPAPVQARALEFVRQAAEVGRGDDDLLGGVTVGKDAYVQALPSTLQDRVEATTIGSPEGTDLEEGVRLSLAVMPSDASNRIVLASDGNETAGSLLAAAEAARALDVPIDVLPFRYALDEEVIVERVVTPSTARMGENITVRVVLNANKATAGTVRLFASGDAIDLDPSSPGDGARVEIPAGVTTLALPIALREGGPQEISAVFEPDENSGDLVAENNRAAAITFFSGQGEVLLVDRSFEESVALVRALKDATIDVRRVEPEQVPADLTQLAGYDAIVLCNLPAYDFSEAQQQALARYVHDAGGGLVMTGGPDSFGAGGWIGSPLEDVLPVQLDPPQRRNMPRGALAVIVHSVEMPEGVYYGKQTARAAIDALSRLDLAGIIEFDWGKGTRWVHPLAVVGDGGTFDRAIESLTFGDMPDMHPSVQMAYEGLVGADAGQKHVIIISDGDPSAPRGTLLREYVDAGITISTVGVFPHSPGDLNMLKRLAESTGGRYYPVTTATALATLPQIFIKEAQTVKRPLIWEGDPIVPTLGAGGLEVMRGITRVPAISGYIVTAEREGLTQVTLRGQEADPVCAMWQHGLGRAVAYTSDVSTRWGAAWQDWPQFRAFWEQHVRWAMRPSGNADVRARLETRGDETVIVVDALDPQGERLNFAQFAGRIAGPNGGSTDVRLAQVGPGRYEGSFRSDDPGSYVMSLRYAAPGVAGGPRIEGSVQAAATRPFTDEFRALEDNSALLRQVAERTGGRVLSSDPQQADLWSRAGLPVPVAAQPIWLATAIAAMGVFLLDVGVRRIRLDMPMIKRSLARALGVTTVTTGEQLGSLRKTRRKVRQSMSETDEDAIKASRAAVERAAEARFEATDTDEAPAPLVDMTPEPTPAESEEPDDAESGMSRLMRAKKKAQQDLEDEHTSGE